ncbi:MAG: flagellar export chaperone FliS, partial [Sulfurimonas sp.]|nr:flagellar export chaperone FliS [Sulfurimonas sp.]
GVLRFNAQAKKAIKDGNIEKKTYWINRSISIITELIAILDFKYGDITFYLEGLYNYQIRSLVHVNIEDDIQRLDEVSKVFKGLSDAWRDVTDVA